MAAGMLKTIANALSIAATAIQAGVSLNESPFMGGAGRNGLLLLDVPIAGGGTVLIQGHPGLASKALPTAGDGGWVTILTLTAASPLQQEFSLPLWIRTNISVLGTGAVTIKLRGVQ